MAETILEAVLRRHPKSAKRHLRFGRAEVCGGAHLPLAYATLLQTYSGDIGHLPREAAKPLQSSC